MKLKCDVLLSTSAFKFNLRRYNLGSWLGQLTIGRSQPVLTRDLDIKVVRCRLTLTNPS